MGRAKLLRIITFVIILIFLVNFLANKFYWYYSVWYFDMIMHFIGGLWLSLLTLYYFMPQRMSLRLAGQILLVVFLIGAGWEVFELLTDRVIAQNPFNILDTTSDIFWDLAGGVAVVLYFLRKTIPSHLNKVQSS